MEVSQSNFKSEVLDSTYPVLVDFWATWCGPCKMMTPIVSELESELKEKVKVCKVNVDEEGLLASTYRIESIPAFLLFKGGKVVSSCVGSCPKDELKAFALSD